ncbi:MAG TPA: hypothetical protein VFC17_01955 [Candidatus Limnocylindrales bacterium]|nr:hypothetical protein [Candidatus Limnocylindrales bacterium]
MKSTTPVRSSLLIAFVVLCQSLPIRAATPIRVETPNLLLRVDVENCRWSAEIKGTPMQLNDVHFLPGDDASGWTVTSSVNNDDSNNLGSFVTVTLRGKKPGQLDFDYQISASKTGNDILVSLGRSNNTGKAVDIGEMDYFVSGDARLGSTCDRWIALGTQSRNRDLYELAAVINLITPKTYAVNHVVQDSDTGNSLLMGHVTTQKGSSRFEVASGWQGKVPDRMQVRGYCSYKVTMPPGKSFPGEKFLIAFNQDALRAMEHQADLIALAHDIRLKTRRPINLDDRELVANNYSRFHGWMSGGNANSTRQFFQTNGLFDFYWGMGGPGRQGSFAYYGSGGSTSGRFPEFDINGNWGTYGSAAAAPTGRSRVNYPAECFLPIRTVKYGGERVIDFSNPQTVKLEHDRAFEWAANGSNDTGRAEMDFSDWWDKWPGQYDPYMSALETYHAGGMPWREAIDQLSPRRVVRSNMQPVDHSYGIVDICRISEDADQGYEEPGSSLAGKEFTGLLTETVLGGANRFFYNGRVFWNDCDGFHIYKYNAPDGQLFNYGQGKVDANFHAIAGNTFFVSEAFNVPYPADRIELLKRISPPTMDVAYPVDLFVRRPAQVWNMPVERPFGKWSVLAVFNYTGRTNRTFTTSLDAAKNLHLDPNKEYIAYEFWTRQLIGTFKGTFKTRALNPYDCDIYSIVEKQDRPVLISTSRHIRQMAFDIKDLAYDGAQRMLRGVSRAVAGDPYQLRIYVPDGFTAKRVELSDGIAPTMKTDGSLLAVDFTASTGKDVEWKVFF